MSDQPVTAPTDRRDFLFKLGTGAGVAALTAQAAASLRFAARFVWSINSFYRRHHHVKAPQRPRHG